MTDQNVNPANVEQMEAALQQGQININGTAWAFNWKHRVQGIPGSLTVPILNEGWHANGANQIQLPPMMRATCEKLERTQDGMNKAVFKLFTDGRDLEYIRGFQGVVKFEKIGSQQRGRPNQRAQ